MSFLIHHPVAVTTPVDSACRDLGLGPLAYRGIEKCENEPVRHVISRGCIAAIWRWHADARSEKDQFGWEFTCRQLASSPLTSVSISRLIGTSMPRASASRTIAPLITSISVFRCASTS